MRKAPSFSASTMNAFSGVSVESFVCFFYVWKLLGVKFLAGMHGDSTLDYLRGKAILRNAAGA